MMQYILIFSGITLVFGILIYLLIQSGLSDLSEEQEARTCLIKGDIMMHNTTLQDFADKNERQNERIALYRRFQEILHEEQPYLFLLAPKVLAAGDKRLHGIRVYPFGIDQREWFVPKALQRYGG